MKINTLVFILFLVVMSLLFFWLHKTLPGRLVSYGVTLKTGGLQLTDTYSETSGTNRIDWTIADAKDVRLHLGRVTTQNPKKYIQDKDFLLRALYEESLSPYPEAITNQISCPAEFKPIKQSINSGVVYKLFAGERLGYGICTKDLIKYDAYYGIFICNTGVFEVKLFSRTGFDKIEKIIQSFQCNS